MNKKRLLINACLFFTLSVLSISTVGVSAPPSSPYIKINPPSQTISSFPLNNRNCTISITTDYSGDDVWGFNIQLTYNPTALECIEVLNGNLITTAKSPTARFLSKINNTIGEVSVGAFFYYTVPPPFTTSGPGTIATITFKILSTGTFSLTLEKDTKLQGYDFGSDLVYDIINAGLQPNNIGHGTVTVTIGDTNSDHTVDTTDLTNMRNAYGSTAGPPPSPNWNPNCDFHGNNKIEVLDLYYQGKNYGKNW